MKTKPLLDINLLPPDYCRRPFFSWTGLAVVLVASLLLALLFPLLDAQARAQKLLSSHQMRLEALAGEEKGLMANEPTATDLRSQLEADENRLAELEADYKTFQQERVDWPVVLDTLLYGLPPGMAFLSFTQEDTDLEATGTATDAQQVVSYVRQLSQGGLFSNIRLNYRDTDKGVEFTLLLKPHGGVQ
jgi:Tfp pilus assembly protein PilN